jgi:hypothetical protein
VSKREGGDGPFVVEHLPHLLQLAKLVHTNGLVLTASREEGEAKCRGFDTLHVGAIGELRSDEEGRGRGDGASGMVRGRGGRRRRELLHSLTFLFPFSIFDVVHLIHPLLSTAIVVDSVAVEEGLIGPRHHHVLHPPTPQQNNTHKLLKHHLTFIFWNVF